MNVIGQEGQANSVMLLLLNSYLQTQSACENNSRVAGHRKKDSHGYQLLQTYTLQCLGEKEGFTLQGSTLAITVGCERLLMIGIKLHTLAGKDGRQEAVSTRKC